jgi:hypothetical protein
MPSGHQAVWKDMLLLDAQWKMLLFVQYRRRRPLIWILEDTKLKRDETGFPAGDNDSPERMKQVSW